MPEYRLTDTDVSYLDPLLSPSLSTEVTAEQLKAVPREDLSLYALKHGIYQFPTVELIDFIRQEIGDRKCIELAAGTGMIGRRVPVRMTDNYMQKRSNIKALYQGAGQETIEYPKDVEKMDADDAVRWLRPSVILACWMTEKWKSGITKDGCIYGADEMRLMAYPWVEKYIFVGNTLTHAPKQIFRKYGVKPQFYPWIYSRSMYKENNAIWIINK